jgi:hypothetical protein
MVRIQCSLTEEVRENTILADNGASHTIINEDWASLVQDFTPMDGSVSGSTQGTLGRVVGEGTINFFGKKYMYMLPTLQHQYSPSDRLAALPTAWNGDY